MKPGDWIVTPRKTKAAIAVGEITGSVLYEKDAPDPYCVSRPVKWLNLEVPRSAVDQDLLDSFGAFMTICQVSRNDAEKRVRSMAGSGWKVNAPTIGTDSEVGGVVPPKEIRDDVETVDLEQVAGDQIAKLIQRQFNMDDAYEDDDIRDEAEFAMLVEALAHWDERVRLILNRQRSSKGKITLATAHGHRTR